MTKNVEVKGVEIKVPMIDVIVRNNEGELFDLFIIKQKDVKVTMKNIDEIVCDNYPDLKDLTVISIKHISKTLTFTNEDIHTKLNQEKYEQTEIEFESEDVPYEEID